MPKAIGIMSQTIQSKHWAKLQDGREVKLYSLKNATGFEAWVSDYGCIITHLWVPKADGSRQDVVLGFDEFADYQKHNLYFGCVVGRYANRIAKGKFSIADKTYQVAKNLQGNHLHGGLRGFDKVLWQASLEPGEEPSICFTHLSEDGDEGYPGNLQTTVRYTLKADNTLEMTFEASTDQPTIVNLTNHTYFNFSGGKQLVYDYELQLFADNILEVDNQLIPTGQIVPVEGDAFDFRMPKKIGKDINKISNWQLSFGSGYDHCFVVNSSSDTLAAHARVVDRSAGLSLDIFSTEPGVQLYTANHLPKVRGKNNIEYRKNSGLCLETQHFPDAPNRPEFKTTQLIPGEMYFSKTVWRFASF